MRNGTENNRPATAGILGPKRSHSQPASGEMKNTGNATAIYTRPDINFIYLE
jgi:hypothetical protein